MRQPHLLTYWFLIYCHKDSALFVQNSLAKLLHPLLLLPDVSNVAIERAMGLTYPLLIYSFSYPCSRARNW
jgi:hypothetical protein